jgi:PleD family two-component response regulator
VWQQEIRPDLPQTPPQQALEVAGQLRVRVANAPRQHAGKVINMTISLGISDTARALYPTKHTGRNRVARHEPGMDAA